MVVSAPKTLQAYIEFFAKGSILAVEIHLQGYISFFSPTHNLRTIGPFIKTLVPEDSKCSNALQLLFSIVERGMGKALMQSR